ncbi:MAG: hypothetical protein COT33_00715 [Candidatus Nealsonbacteria bacterium CG08_land_8_20_14_0_20_38_20]|uniref:Uncharacterized protein n=1 Tax=Candidatus Nealsonbacteria bacterium CG08_land_8_20_14_0_20_38_20 TaxID=1974705 RepID=A0A2H0YMJ6_9BACT|nr:MAG: hypothetical protein COT33_00715 [Candidatus Nealsonbacteria bacterium CG08_land_8_20_14_0_20_38_20]
MHPGGVEASKGLAVRQLKQYVSWVQTVNTEPLNFRKFGKFPDNGIEYTRRLSTVMWIEKSTHIGEVLLFQFVKHAEKRG